MFLPLLSHLSTVKAEARSQPSNLFEAISNGMGDGRFPSPSVAMKPEYARGVVVCAIDPGSDLVEDFSPGALQTDFLGV